MFADEVKCVRLLQKRRRHPPLNIEACPATQTSAWVDGADEGVRADSADKRVRADSADKER